MDRREFLIKSVAASSIIVPEMVSGFDVSRFISKVDREKPDSETKSHKEDKASESNPNSKEERFVWLTRRDSGEEFKEIFYADGKYNFSAYKKFCWIMRDLRGGDEMIPMDANLLNIAYKIQNTLLGFDVRKPININSGYRSPKTNANTEGAAKNSYHLKGRAIDISMEGMDPSLVGYLGVIMAKGGVGFYPMKNFIHLDTGDKRQWIVNNKNQLKMLDN